jgi:hypothetical protein|nr:hypothetical protein [uncultured Psychroserpens sp.]
MKNILKLIPIIILVFTFSCDDEDNRFSNDPTTGWVEFISSATTTGQTSPVVSIPLSIRVPQFDNGLNISYSIQAVEGDFTQFVSSSSGSVYADPSIQPGVDGDSRALSIDLDLANMDAGRDFVTSFDITLTAVDASSVTVGVNGSTNILTHRVTIPCSNPQVLPNDYFVGDYSIVDTVATIGPGNGTENFAAGTVTLTADPFNTNGRIFSSGVLPAFNGEVESVSIFFTTDNIAILGDVDPGLACSAAGPYVFTAAADGNAPWDICNDQGITITYTEDPNGSCGGPYVSSFTLTKL